MPGQRRAARPPPSVAVGPRRIPLDVRRAQAQRSGRARVRPGLQIDPLVPALVIFAFALDLIQAGKKSVWLDEAISDSYARESFGRFWHAASHTDPNMSLYYLLLRPWLVIFGDG